MRAIALCVFLLAGGCAPSLRMVHQSHAYFERCHAADFDPRVRPDLRRQCWARWLQHYTYGQPPDRVQYARGRLAALEDGEAIDPLPGLAPTAVGTRYTASFLTTAAHAEDASATAGGNAAPAGLSTEARVEATVGGVPRVDPAEDLPAPPDVHGACANVCMPRWNDCVVRCDGRARTCREACEAEHRTCMRGCY